MSAPPYSPTASENEAIAASGTPGAGAASDLAETSPGRKSGIILWAVLSSLILLFISFGSVTTRFWQLDVFQQAWTQEKAPRRVFHVWMYQLDHLPYSSSPTLLKVAFAGALLVIVVGVVMSIWLILSQGNPSTSTDASPPTEAS